MMTITLFTSFTLVYIDKVRRETRDVKRLADLGQVRAGLELYLHARGAYPQGKNILLGTREASALDTRGWVASPKEPAYLLRLTPDPLPIATNHCVQSVHQPCAYSYTSTTGTDYTIRFFLEHGIPPLSAPGIYQLTPQGYRP